MKLFITLIIQAATEVHKGVDNLWLEGDAPGEKAYPSDSQYVPKY